MIESGVADVVFIDKESQEHAVYQLVAGDCIGLSGLLSFSVSSTKANFLLGLRLLRGNQGVNRS